MGEQGLPEPGDIYRHKGNGKEYRVVEIVQVEKWNVWVEEYEWTGGVRYQQAGAVQFHESYVRTLDRFTDRFEFVRIGG